MRNRILTILAAVVLLTAVLPTIAGAQANGDITTTSVKATRKAR